MAEFKMTPALKSALAGYMPFAEGETATIHLLPEPVEGQDPTISIKVYSLQGMKKRREPLKEGEAFAERLVSLFEEGEGLVGWDGIVGPNGRPFPFSVQNIRNLPDKFLLRADEEILNYVRGELTPEEK